MSQTNKREKIIKINFDKEIELAYLHQIYHPTMDFETQISLF